MCEHIEMIVVFQHIDKLHSFIDLATVSVRVAASLCASAAVLHDRRSRRYSAVRFWHSVFNVCPATSQLLHV